MTDISIPVDGCRLNFRVGAIVRQEGKVLICRLPGKDWWYTPGGRLKVRESSTEALERELREEVGENWKIKESVLISENFFTLEGEEFHEVCIYYEIDWLGELETEQMRNAEEEFLWVQTKDLKKYQLQPGFMPDYLNSPEAPFSHSIYRNGQPVAGANATR